MAYGRRRYLNKRRTVRRRRFAGSRRVNRVARFGRKNRSMALSMRGIPPAVPSGQKIVRFKSIWTQRTVIPAGVGVNRPVFGIVANTLFWNAVNAAGAQASNAAVPGQIYFSGYELHSRIYKRYRVLGSRLKMTVIPRYDPAGAGEQRSQFMVGIAMEPQTVNQNVRLDLSPEQLLVQRQSNLTLKVGSRLLAGRGVSVTKFYSARKTLGRHTDSTDEVLFTKPGLLFPDPLPEPFRPASQPTFFPCIWKMGSTADAGEFPIDVRYTFDVIAVCWDKFITDILPGDANYAELYNDGVA